MPERDAQGRFVKPADESAQPLDHLPSPMEMTREDLVAQVEELNRRLYGKPYGPGAAAVEQYRHEQGRDLPKRPIRDPEGFDRPIITPGGCLLVIVAGALLFAVTLVWLWFPKTSGYQPSPSPAPAPVVIGDYAKTAEIAGKVEDRLYADVFEQLADDVESGRIKTGAQWQKVAKERFYDARFKAQEQVHRALDEILPTTGEIKDPRGSAKALREIASGYRRSGK